MPDDHSTTESTSSWGVVDMDEDEGDATQVLRSSAGNEHVWCKSRFSICFAAPMLMYFPAFDFAFDDVIITCVTMFPEQFHALRRMCECEKSIIESLVASLVPHF